MKRAKALGIAQTLVDDLKSHCERIQIAGSLRRGAQKVKDIEIVAIPDLGDQVEDTDLFGEVLETHYEGGLDDHLEQMLRDSTWPWARDTEIRRWGDRYKRLRHDVGICCDLFLTDERRWGYQLCIRTGPADFSRAIVTLALRRGWHFSDSLLHQHLKHGGMHCPKGESCPLIIPTPEERDIFDRLGLPWCEPAERSEEWLWKKAKDRIFKE